MWIFVFYESVESLYNSRLTMPEREIKEKERERGGPQLVFMLSASVGNLNFDWCVIVKMVNSVLRLEQQAQQHFIDPRMHYKSAVRYMENACSC